MALAKGEMHVQFRGGINRKSDEKSVPATQLLTLENGVFTRGTSIAKRNGYTDLGQQIDGSANTLADAIRLGRRDDELLAFTSNRCYSQQRDEDQWSDTGAVISAIGADRPLVKTGTQQTMSDQAEFEGIRVVAWEDSLGGVYWSVVDAVSGRIHRASTLADAVGQSPRCVAVGDNLHVYYAVPTQGRIMCLVVNPATPSAAVSPVILTDDLDATNPVYDACPTTRPTTPALIAWHESATTNYRIGFVDSSGALGSPGTGHPSVVREAVGMDAASPIACAYADGTGELFVVAYVAGGNLKVTEYDDDLSFLLTQTATSATSMQRIALGISSGGNQAFVVAGEEAAGAASNRFVKLVPFAVTPGSVVTMRSVGLASRAWAIGDDVFAVFVHDTTYFNTYVTLRLSDGLSVGRHVPGSAAGAPTRKHLSSAHVADSVASIALPVKQRLLSENDDKFTETGISLVTLNFDSEDSHQSAQLGRGLYLAGACPMHYDGRVWSEQGFHFGPELIATVSAAGGSMSSGVTYLYRAWYESTDAQGEIHRGPTSFGTLVTMGGGDTQVTLTLPTLRVTGKTTVRICVARSKAADTGNTAQLFRVTSLDPSAVGANGYVANDITVDTVSFLDRMSDTTLSLQEELYTDGGILSNDPSPLGPVIAVGKSRLFATDPSDGLVVRFSQQLDDGYGVEFPPDLSTKVDPFGGDVTALAVMDDSVIAFKAGAIFMFGGDGPPANGDVSTQGFSAPRLVTSDVGCTDPSSIALTPVGLMFKSAKGIYLLDRSGSVSYVGALVEAFNGQLIRQATVMPDRTQIVFLTDDGTTLLYDYFFGSWSTFTNHLGRSAVVVSGAYHYLRTDGRVFRETVGLYSDAGTRITLRLETAWIHVAEALQGFQRFWNTLVLGTWISPHQLVFQYRTNYAPGWSEPDYVDATGEATSAGWITGSGADPIGEDPITGSVYGDGPYGDGLYGGDDPDIYQWRFHIGGRGQSVQFRFEDFERDGLTGASFELTEMLIEGGVAGTSYKPIAASRSA